MEESPYEMRKMEETPLYIEDKIGIRSLNESGRLSLIFTNGDHQQLYFSNHWGFRNFLQELGLYNQLNE